MFSFEWLFASVAAKVREESPDTHCQLHSPLLIFFLPPLQQGGSYTLEVSLFVLYFIFSTSSFLPLHSLLQGPSINSWQFEVNISLEECRGQEYIWDCRFPTPHSMHIVTESHSEKGQKTVYWHVLFSSHSATCKYCSSTCESLPATSVYPGQNGDLPRLGSPVDFSGIMGWAEKHAFKNC